MKMKSEPLQDILITVEGKDFPEFMLPPYTPEKKLFAKAKYLGHDPRDQLEASIIKLFKQAFDIDIKTCTNQEWTERITIEGGALKQWQSFIEVKEEETHCG